ncbi:MAG TPA: response regulator transcription factor [Polyangiaceae bacterium LLY-WYZ-15_(1-7)]|nr:DNA-binding response regulator [Myxococcales bacterium]MAT26320.1 DNA-binding response regulator [Sandaracinus sp.]HJK94196.1 response regulator transcription factor [Polyangiaceae bacterium LLY-WYZ-15_(1-7)]MBJ70079.1 DNA-binding response regulator [Sandaracinus sp.]HJL02311.1 response regulator transcription factor [Polyangiaceae bacterium LLY-WYZ-15_(1-7)]
MGSRILVVEDESDLAELVAFNLKQAGHVVTTAGTGATALAEIRRQRPDLVVLDVMLPDITGLEVCRRLRRDEATARLPVLMLTAKGEEVDRVVGFEVGADDYVTKPFSPRELLLRIEAILRRMGGQDEEGPQTLSVGELTIDVPGHRVKVEDEEISLTALEFRLLLDLAKRRGRVQSRNALLERVWGYAPGIETRTVDTHVKRLREKLGVASKFIETVRGVGYRMRSDAN